jgi:hypothetical protein
MTTYFCEDGRHPPSSLTRTPAARKAGIPARAPSIRQAMLNQPAARR